MGERITDLADPAFDRLFTSVQRSWFRLETLQRYDVEYERDEFAAFLRGEPLDTASDEWREMIRQHVASSRRLSRVHVIEEPLNDYVRYELAGYPRSVEAGEDVRVIPVQRGDWPAGVPRHDWWLFDDERLWLMHYDDAGRFIAAERIDDPGEVTRHIAWREVALAQSIPLAAYTATLPRAS